VSSFNPENGGAFTSEISVTFYETTQCYIPNLLQLDNDVPTTKPDCASDEKNTSSGLTGMLIYVKCCTFLV
jgi:hypothetical protein